jgi:BMFP domain-containing protein YqiC
MLNTINFDDLAKRLSAAIPPGLTAAKADVDKTLHAMLQDAFEKMNLVSREEFEAQKAVLARTRSLLEQLEARVAELERHSPPPSP